MIATCPLTGRSVANDEWIAQATDGRWYPTAAMNGDGPTIAGEIVRNHDYHYVSVIDPDNPRKRALVLGPFPTHDEALANMTRAKRLAECDPKSFWYAWGTASSLDNLPAVLGP